jgi:hypothetical protein
MSDLGALVMSKTNKLKDLIEELADDQRELGHGADHRWTGGTMKRLIVDDRELATILAALRMWARLGARQGPVEEDTATDGGLLESLTAHETQALGDRLNLGKRVGRPGTPTHCGKCGALCQSAATARVHCKQREETA